MLIYQFNSGIRSVHRMGIHHSSDHHSKVHHSVHRSDHRSNRVRIRDHSNRHVRIRGTSHRLQCLGLRSKERFLHQLRSGQPKKTWK